MPIALSGAGCGKSARPVLRRVWSEQSEHSTHTLITDVQISERAGKGAKVREQFRSSLDNGTSSGTYQTSTKDSDFLRYRTRIVSNADKVNLTFAEAKSALEQGLVKTLTGIF